VTGTGHQHPKAVTRKKCPDPEIENLRQVFEALDTNSTGKISFENFLLNSGMKGEVFKGFNRRAGLKPLLPCSAESLPRIQF
jgi:hypothetical protein